MPTPKPSRDEQITAMYEAHSDRLHAFVARRARTDSHTIEDACAHAWTQLARRPDIDDLTLPAWGAVAWLTTTAVREAWRLAEHQQHLVAVKDDDTLGTLAAARGITTPAADTVAAQHVRLDLLAEIPERPRRFLLRLGLGYSYAEIAEAERVSYTTTNAQIAKAKRILRDLQAQDAAAGGEYPAAGA